MSVKNPLRNFGDAKTNKNNILPSYDLTSLSIQLTRIGKMLEESILKFTKRYLIISTEFEEMKREFIGQVSLVTEYLNLTKKEIRYEKYDSFNQGKYSNVSNIPIMPNYEQKAILRGEKRDNKVFYNRINNNLNVNNNNNRYNSSIQKNKKSNSSNSRIISPDLRKNKSNSTKSIIDDKGIYSKKINKSKNKIRNDNKPIKNYHLKKEEILDSLSDNQSKGIFLLIDSNIVPYEEKIKLLFTKRNIFNNIKPKDILIQELKDLQIKIKKLKNNKLNEEDKKIINKVTSYPSKTAKTGLNFLTPERESELINNDNEVNIILIKMIYTCLNEEYLSNNVKEGYEYLFKKYNVNSIKTLFLNVIYKKVFNDSLNDETNENTEKIINDISQNKMLMANNLVSNTNKTFSYVCFSLDEISEFLNEVKGLNKEMRNNIKKEVELNKLIEDEQEIKKRLQK